MGDIGLGLDDSMRQPFDTVMKNASLWSVFRTGKMSYWMTYMCPPTSKLVGERSGIVVTGYILLNITL